MLAAACGDGSSTVVGPTPTTTADVWPTEGNAQRRLRPAFARESLNAWRRQRIEWRLGTRATGSVAVADPDWEARR
jgi:hypothetical protein